LSGPPSVDAIDPLCLWNSLPVLDSSSLSNANNSFLRVLCHNLYKYICDSDPFTKLELGDLRYV
jgi:hypothetical protein